MPKIHFSFEPYSSEFSSLFSLPLLEATHNEHATEILNLLILHRFSKLTVLVY